jgi:hypothetical protein
MLHFLLFLAQVVPFAHNDLNQSGANTSESRLTPSNVIPGKFGNGVELWNSDMSGRDALGLISKFAAPTIADGTVMVVTNSGTLVTFGLLSASQLRGNAVLRGSAGIR